MIKKDKIVIVSNINYCNSLFSKATGLRFRWLKKDSAYVFKFNKSQKVLMDMFFVFYPIDVVFLDKENVIVEMKEKFYPFTFYSSKKEANIIIEFSSKTIKKFDLVIGDKLIIE